MHDQVTDNLVVCTQAPNSFTDILDALCSTLVCREKKLYCRPWSRLPFSLSKIDYHHN